MGDKIVTIFTVVIMMLLITTAVALGNMSNRFYEYQKEQISNENSGLVKDNTIKKVKMNGRQLKSSLTFLRREKEAPFTNGYYDDVTFTGSVISGNITQGKIDSLQDSTEYTIEYLGDGEIKIS